MIPCERYAFYTLARDASFVTLAGTLMMVGASFDPPLAFKVGASVALVFAIVLILRSYGLSDEGFRRCEVWQALRPEERPQGEHGFQIAKQQFELLLLRFAKASAGVASTLFGLALVGAMHTADPAVDGIVTAGTMHLP